MKKSEFVLGGFGWYYQAMAEHCGMAGRVYREPPDALVGWIRGLFMVASPVVRVDALDFVYELDQHMAAGNAEEVPAEFLIPFSPIARPWVVRIFFRIEPGRTVRWRTQLQRAGGEE